MISPLLSFCWGGGRGGAPRKGNVTLFAATLPGGGGGGRLSSIALLCGGGSGRSMGRAPAKDCNAPIKSQKVMAVLCERCIRESCLIFIFLLLLISKQGFKIVFWHSRRPLIVVSTLILLSYRPNNDDNNIHPGNTSNDSTHSNNSTWRHACISLTS